jgi:hypothetical protein
VATAMQMVSVRLNSTDELLGYMDESLVPDNKNETLIINGVEYLFVRRELSSQNKVTVIVEKKKQLRNQ